MVDVQVQKSFSIIISAKGMLSYSEKHVHEQIFRFVWCRADGAIFARRKEQEPVNPIVEKKDVTESKRKHPKITVLNSNNQQRIRK